MNNGIDVLHFTSFATVYLLLLVVLAIMRRSRINQMKLLLVASLRMTVQLTLAGIVLTVIFQNPHPLLVTAYLGCMLLYAIVRSLNSVPCLNRRFRLGTALSLSLSGLGILLFFVLVVARQSLFDPQYTIPLAGMIIGNTMTGVTLAIKTFTDALKTQRPKIETLLNLGVHPRRILLPLVNSAFETALLPTLNTMLGMGVVSLPGMMTGQILSGTLPTTAILYQIAMMISICASVCLASFCTLRFGCSTLYNDRYQLLL